MDVGAPLIAHAQAAKAADPSRGALELAAVAAQAGAGLDSTPRDARPDAASAQQRRRPFLWS